MAKFPTLYEFNALPEFARYQFAWDDGTFLTNRLEGNARFNLYSCGDFFVEVEYDDSTSKIVGMKTFKSIKQLDSFLEGIHISDEIQ